MDLESVSPAPCQSSTVLSQVNTYDVARASAPMDTGQIGTIVHASRYNVTVVYLELQSISQHTILRSA